MIYWILMSSFVSFGAYSVCAPILPLFFEGRGITGAYVGLSFSLFAFGAIIWAPIVGKYLVDKIKPAHLIGASMMIMGTTFVCFGFLCHLETNRNILILSCVLRTIEGMASTTHYTASVTKIAMTYQTEEKEKYFGYNSAATTTGLMTGPVIGSTLFQILGYEYMFYVYGGLEIILAVVVWNRLIYGGLP